MDPDDDTVDHLRLSERIDKLQLAKLMIGNNNYAKALSILEPLRTAYEGDDEMHAKVHALIAEAESKQSQG